MKYMQLLRQKRLWDFVNLKYSCWTLYSDAKNCLSEARFSDGRTLSLRSGKLAKMADGCGIAQFGDTAVMVTAVGKTVRASNSYGFMPLTVDYRQKAAAAGRIPTNFLRRELGASEKEILTSRIIDRSLRPMFFDGYGCETQIICNMLSVDGVNDPDIVSVNAASLALCLSDIPWRGPVAAVRVGMVNNELRVNPSRREMAESSLNLIVTATDHNLVVMLEAGANEMYLQDFQAAVKFGVKECQVVAREIKNLQAKFGKPKRTIDNTTSVTIPENVIAAIKSVAELKLKEVFTDSSFDKIARDNAVNVIRGLTVDQVKESFPDVEMPLINEAFSKVLKKVFRNLILEEKVRCDGRTFDGIRNITCEVDLFKPLHGSALFQRGQTQVFCTVAFDSIDSALKSDPISILTGGMKEKNFFLHYEFPPFATNETGRSGGGAFGRRELGHGALAEKALRPIVPNDFPFTIRLTSEVFESNGSSSMASVCGGSLALMDAGVPINAPAAGVAMGLVTTYEDNDTTKRIKDYAVLTDILGIEDYLGDMDFKLAGTKKALTAVQLDTKLPGIPLKIVMEALQQGSTAKHTILEIMHETMERPRFEKKDNWPVSEKIDVPAHKRIKFLGHGGRNVKKLLADTGAQVTQLDDNIYYVFAPNQSAMNEAKELIDIFLKDEKEPELEFGAIYTAKIEEIRDIGVMISLYPGMHPVLLHNSQLDARKIFHPSAIGLQVGQEIQVKYFGRDPVSGSMRISRKVLTSTASSVIKDLGATSRASASSKSE